jgi:hypothetical protein
VQQNPPVPDACLVITQQHQFFKEGSQGACEASGGLGCGVYKPIVKYKYLRDVNAPQLVSLNTVQRAYFIPVPRGAQPPLANSAALFHDCELPLAAFGGAVINPALTINTFLNNLFVSPGLITPSFASSLPQSSVLDLLNCLVSANTQGTIHIADTFKGENPQHNEVNLQVVHHGQAIPVTGNNGEGIDNLHLTYNNFVVEPRFNAGCPECVHIHWRWASFLKPGFPHVDPTFDKGGGQPVIPAGSTQDISIILTEKQPGDDNPVSVDSLVPPGQEGNALSHPVFWYSATGHQPSDQFFIHGLFFATLWMENVTYSSASNTVTFEIKHNPAHPVTWTARLVAGIPDVLLVPISLPDPTPNNGIVSGSTGSDNTVLTTLPLIANLVPPIFATLSIELQDTVTGAKTKASFVVRDGPLQDLLP